MRNSHSIRSDPLAFSAALLHFPAAAPDHVTFAFHLYCSWETNCAPLTAWNLTFWLTTAAICDRLRKTDNRFRKAVKFSFRLFAVTSKTNKFNYAERQPNRKWREKKKHNRIGQIRKAPTPNSKAICQKIGKNWQKPKTRQPKQRQISECDETPGLTPARPINPLPFPAKAETTSMPNTKVSDRQGKRGKSLALFFASREISEKFEKKKSKWKSIAAAREKVGDWGAGNSFSLVSSS